MTNAKMEIGRDEAALRRIIAEKVVRLPIGETDAWPDLTVLSTHTRVDSVEVFETDIRLKGNRFEGLINVHCTLRYDGEGEATFETSETFPGRFEGTLRAEGPSIVKLTVDTASFYA